MEDSEGAFWTGCYREQIGEYGVAKEYFDTALAGSLNKRMRFAALQNQARCFIHLGEWAEALAAYEKLKESARLPSTKEGALECIGYIKALRDFNVKLTRRLILAPAPAEFEEFEVIDQAEKILLAKTVSYSDEISPLSQVIDKQTAIDAEIRKILSDHCGFSIEYKLGEEVVGPLVAAEKNYMFQKEFSQAIVDFHDAVASLLQERLAIKLLPFVKDQEGRYHLAKVNVRQWAYLLGAIDDPNPLSIRDESCRILLQPFQNFVRARYRTLDHNVLKALTADLHTVQNLRNPYIHKERGVISGAKG